MGPKLPSDGTSLGGKKGGKGSWKGVSDGFFFAETFEADKSMLILPMEIVVVANCSTFFPSKFPSTFLHELLKSEFCKTVSSRLHRQIFIGQRNEHRN
jgi:hypothetical protein